LQNNFTFKFALILFISLFVFVSSPAAVTAQTSEVNTAAPHFEAPEPPAAPAAAEPAPVPAAEPAPAPAEAPAPTEPPAPAAAPAASPASSDDAIKSLVEQIKTSGRITEEKLANGIKLIYRKNTSSDMVVMKIAVKAGSIYETEKNNGISCLLFELLRKGNAKMKADEISKTIEQTGAIFKADVSKNLGTVTLVSTTKSFEKNFDVVAECVISSNFPPAEVEKEKQFLVGALKAENDKMDVACAKLFYKTMFAGHPYALHHYGSVESVPKITKNDIAKWYKTVFTPENMTIVVVGNVEYDFAKQAVEKRFGAMKPVTGAMKAFDEVNKKIAEGVKPYEAPREAKEFKDKSQAFIYYGFVTEGVESKDYGALKMLSTVLGSGMSSRLFHNLRDKESLAYQVTAYYQTHRGNSALIALIGTQPQKYEQAVTGLKREIEVFKNELISEEEYARAKNKLVGNYALQRNTMEDQAEFLGLWEGLGLGAKFEDEYLQSVLAPTREDIQNVAKKYFDQNKFVLSVIYPESKEKKAEGAPAKKNK
jgi:predicted Zn-dependent peptidase